MSLRPTDGSELRLMARAALLYHSSGLTQAEVALRLGVSRPTAGRLLRRAREIGLVRVTIEWSLLAVTERERELEERFGLTEAVIVADVSPSETAMRDLVGAAAADVLVRRVADGMVLGCGWGATTLAVAEHLPPAPRSRVRVVQLDGSLGSHGHQSSAEQTLALVSAAFGGSALGLAAPLYADPRTVRSLLSDSLVAPVLSLASGSDVMLYSVGNTSPESTLFSGRVLPAEAIDELRAAGAVGDAFGRFFGSDGTALATGLSHRTVAVSLDDLRRCRLSVLVASGAAKAAAVRAAVTGGLAKVLVTDEVIADALLAAPVPVSDSTHPHSLRTGSTGSGSGSGSG